MSPECIILERNYRLAQWAAGLLGLKDEAIYPDEMGDAEEYACTVSGTSVAPLGRLVDLDDLDDDGSGSWFLLGKPRSEEEVLRKLVKDLAIVGITEEDILAKMKSLLKEVKRGVG